MRSTDRREGGAAQNLARGYTNEGRRRWGGEEGSLRPSRQALPHVLLFFGFVLDLGLSSTTSCTLAARTTGSTFSSR
jgi:hypothetical protein